MSRKWRLSSRHHAAEGKRVGPAGEMAPGPLADTEGDRRRVGAAAGVGSAGMEEEGGGVAGATQAERAQAGSILERRPASLLSYDTG